MRAPRDDGENGTQTQTKLLRFPPRAKPRVEVTLWEKQAKPDGEALRALLTSDGFQVVQWRAEPEQALPPHAHIYPELLWLLEGSLTYLLPGEKRWLELAPGDRIETPTGTMHAVVAGPDGARYLIATK